MTPFAKTPAMQAAHALASQQLAVGINSAIGAKNLLPLSKGFFAMNQRNCHRLRMRCNPKKLKMGCYEILHLPIDLDTAFFV